MRITLAVSVCSLLLTSVSGSAQDLADFGDPFEAESTDSAVLAWPDQSLLRITLYDNGPLVNCPGCGANGADESQVQTVLNMSSYGFDNLIDNGASVADDFIVIDGVGWWVEDMSFFVYQPWSGGAVTITALYVRIWDGDPTAGGCPMYGDMATNILETVSWSNIYRVSDVTSGNTDRPIMELVAPINIGLWQGTYWVEWSTDGTLLSGTWVAPITISGQTTTGNGLLHTTTWNAAMDNGTGTRQGFPFIVYGNVNYPSDGSPGSSKGSSQVIGGRRPNAEREWPSHGRGIFCNGFESGDTSVW